MRSSQTQLTLIQPHPSPPQTHSLCSVQAGRERDRVITDCRVLARLGKSVELEVDDFACARRFEQGEGGGDADQAVIASDGRLGIIQNGVVEVAQLLDVGSHARLAKGGIGIFGVDWGLFRHDTPIAVVGKFKRFIGVHIQDARFAHDEGAEGLVGEAGLRAGAGSPQCHDRVVVKEN